MEHSHTARGRLYIIKEKFSVSHGGLHLILVGYLGFLFDTTMIRVEGHFIHIKLCWDA